MYETPLLESKRDSFLPRETPSYGIETTRLSAALTESSIENPNRELYIAELDGKSVGTVRVDYCHESQYCELSWTIAPNSRGQGLGKSMVGLMACKIDYQIFAEIKQGNIESARIAESVGMQLKCTENGIMYWRN